MSESTQYTKPISAISSKKFTCLSRTSSRSSVGSCFILPQEQLYRQRSPSDGTLQSGASEWVSSEALNPLSHLHNHAMAYGINVNSQKSPSEMSHSSDIVHSPSYLSWRKLHLSKAKLKAASNTSALLAGFAMVAMVEIQLQPVEKPCPDNPKEKCEFKLPEPLLITFAVCTTLLVAVHMLALLISTCILPNMEAISSLHSLSLVNESPHEKMHVCIELAWGCSTVAGILLFMVEIAVLCWVQFYHVSTPAAIVATAILIPFVIVFILFAINFYQKLVSHNYKVRESDIRELEERFHLELETEGGAPTQSRQGAFLSSVNIV